MLGIRPLRSQHESGSRTSKPTQPFTVGEDLVRPRIQLMVLLSASLVVLAAGPAAADVESQAAYVWEGGSRCTKAFAEVSHGDFNQGYQKAFSEARDEFWTPYGGIHCERRIERPTGWLRVRYDLLKYNKRRDKWLWCAGTQFTKNTAPDYNHHQQWHWETVPCGNGRYKLQTFAHQWYNNAWKGGPLMSPSHYWPIGDLSEDGDTGAPDPYWEANPSLMPDALPLSGPTGDPVTLPDGKEVMVPIQKVPTDPEPNPPGFEDAFDQMMERTSNVRPVTCLDLPTVPIGCTRQG